MIKLTKLQKQVYDELQANKEKFSLAETGRKIGVSRQAILDRLRGIVKKGYVIQEEGIYVTTHNGRSKLIKDGGETKHSYYDKERNWEKTLNN